MSDTETLPAVVDDATSGDAPEPLSAEQQRRRAAITFVSLGPAQAAQVLRHLTPQELDELIIEVTALGRFTHEEAAAALRDFSSSIARGDHLTKGGPRVARAALERAFGDEQAGVLMERVSNMITGAPFDFLRRVDPSQIYAFLQHENVQTVALVLAYMPSTSAAGVLSMFPPEQQSEIALRVARLDRTSPEVMREIEEVMQRKLSSLISQDLESAGGVPSLVDILNYSDRATERVILEHLDSADTALAEEVRKLIFVFEDLLILEPKAIQKVLKDVDQKDLALAMKGTSEDLRQMIFDNLSDRATEMLREEIEFLGEQRRRNIEEAQGKIVAIVRALEQDGSIEIIRPGTGDDDDELIA
jgi:flagellar motor switch protein FliG